MMGTAHLTMVLMDGGSSLNILYASTLDKMGIPQSNLCPSKALFYGIVLGKEAVPLGCFQLNVTFGQLDNFCKEPLTFDVIDFPGVYHALLGRPCFAKFMAIPNYVAQAAVLIAPCAPDGPGHDSGRAPLEGAAKATAVLDQPSISEAAFDPSNGHGAVA
jgi:hypothetical protein